MSWPVAPGVLRLSGNRLAGGAPFRVVKLSDQGGSDLTAGRDPALLDRLARYGLLTRPAAPPAGEAAIADLTVVIPARCPQAHLDTLLATVPSGVAVVVVDDGSPSPLRVRSGVGLLRNGQPLGPGAARNAGARVATTGTVVFVDSDVTLGAGVLPALAGELAQPGVVAAAPRIRTTGRGLDALAPALDLGPDRHDVRRGGPVSYLPSAVLAVDRETYTTAGGFDETLTVGEDVDLVWRLAEVGRVSYCPHVEASHRPRSAPAALRRRIDYGTSAAGLDERHPGSVRHAAVAPAALATAAAWFAHPLLGLAASGATALRSRRLLAWLPWQDALRVDAAGQLAAARSLARWAVRPMFPVAAVLLLRRRCRGRLALVALIGVLLHPRQGGRSTPAAVGAGVVDDLAYSLGVWHGCLSRRRADPLLPWRPRG